MFQKFLPLVAASMLALGAGAAWAQKTTITVGDQLEPPHLWQHDDRRCRRGH
mgnify:CR=1 FL=1